MPRWDAREFLTLLCDRNLGVTHTLAVPTQYQMICHLPRSAGAPSAELYAAVGGAPVTPELVAACAEWGLNLRPAYGMTECFSIASIARGAAVSEHGAVGQPSAATELRIADAQGHRVPTGSIGEIQIRGAAVTPGYWRQSDETAAAFVDGWFRTRDLGRLDAAGNLYIVDRAKDMFISGGENVYPAEVEQALQSLAGVRQAAVVGVPDERWGEVGAAFIVLADGATLDRERIVAHCRERIARFKVPQHVHLVSELPLSAQGKVLKSELRKRHD
jgi:fatty-acyl-CoA synthase